MPHVRICAGAGRGKPPLPTATAGFPTSALAPRRAVRYIRGVAIYIFQSGKDPRRFAYTTDKSGAGLPDDLDPWRPWGGQAVSTDTSKSVVERDKRIREEIEDRGYYLFTVL
jgi:hypothetical protein